MCMYEYLGLEELRDSNWMEQRLASKWNLDSKLRRDGRPLKNCIKRGIQTFQRGGTLPKNVRKGKQRPMNGEKSEAANSFLKKGGATLEMVLIGTNDVTITYSSQILTIFLTGEIRSKIF